MCPVFFFVKSRPTDYWLVVQKARTRLQINSDLCFSDEDKQSCEVYAYLVEKVAPQEKKQFMHSTKAILDAVDLVQRAEMVLQNAEMLDCRVFVRPQDIVSGSQKLNLAFLANLFHGYPALEKPVEVEEEVVCQIEETREEKTYRNWINSMGIDPVVNHLFGDLTDGIVLLKLFDVTRSETVDWSLVHTELCRAPAKANFQRLENCNYVIQLGREAGFSLVGVGGNDIERGKIMMILALLWQLMRAYTLAMLTRLTRYRTARIRSRFEEREKPIGEAEIIDWTNDKLFNNDKQSRLSPFKGFNDSMLASGIVIIDLIDAIRPGSVDYSVISPGKTKQEQLSNAQYAIALARRIGAKVYAVPEDLVEMKSKMIMTIFACLMSADMEEDEENIHSESSKASARNASNNDTDFSYSKATGNVIIHDNPVYSEPPPAPLVAIESTESRGGWYPSIAQIPKPYVPEKVYVKQLHFTISNDGKFELSNEGVSQLFTQDVSGSGDCCENLHLLQQQKHPRETHIATPARKGRDKISKVHTKPRFLSPTGKRENYHSTGQLRSGHRFSQLSRSIPSLHILEELDSEENSQSEMSQRVGSNEFQFDGTIVEDPTMSKLSIRREADEICSLEQSWDYTTTSESRMNPVGLSREKLNQRKSTGGGRLFLATKYKL